MRVRPERADNFELHRRIRARVRRQVDFGFHVRGRRRVARGDKLDLGVAQDILHHRDGEFCELLHQFVIVLAIVVVITVS